MRRFVVSIVCVSTLVSCLVLAAPASAVSSPPSFFVVCANSGTETFATTDPAIPAGYPVTSINADPGDRVRIYNYSNVTNNFQVNPARQCAQSASLTVALNGTTVTIAAGANEYVSLSTGTMILTLASLSAVSASVSVRGDSGAGDQTSTGAPAPAPVLETLSLAVEANGASCRDGNPTGYSGTWMALPKADECTQSGPTAKPGAKLLGWSPNANFPVDVAQNQIAKGWGVYDGPINGVRMIFIPAGMSTYVTGSNTLYPVWSA